jgi:hypothetical protein
VKARTGSQQLRAGLLVAASLTLAGLATGCSSPVTGPSPVPASAKAAPPMPTAAATVGPTITLRDGLLAPTGTTLLGAVRTTTVDGVSGWSATLRLEAGVAGSAVVTDLRAQLVSIGFAVTSGDARTLHAQRTEASTAGGSVGSSAGQVFADVDSVDAANSVPGYVRVLVNTVPPGPASQ